MRTICITVVSCLQETFVGTRMRVGWAGLRPDLSSQCACDYPDLCSRVYPLRLITTRIKTKLSYLYDMRTNDSERRLGDGRNRLLCFTRLDCSVIARSCQVSGLKISTFLDESWASTRLQQTFSLFSTITKPTDNRLIDTRKRRHHLAAVLGSVAMFIIVLVKPNGKAHKGLSYSLKKSPSSIKGYDRPDNFS